jgi:hypothetical protein
MRPSMIARPPIALLAVIAIISTPAPLRAQEGSSGSVDARLSVLESRVADLEHRLGELEAMIKQAPQKERLAKTSGNWKELANWRRLSRGMSMDQVRALLGEPDRVTGGGITRWRWGKPEEAAEVYFIEDRLEGWTEPRRGGS